MERSDVADHYDVTFTGEADIPYCRKATFKGEGWPPQSAIGIDVLYEREWSGEVTTTPRRASTGTTTPAGAFSIDVFFNEVAQNPDRILEQPLFIASCGVINRSFKFVLSDLSHSTSQVVPR